MGIVRIVLPGFDRLPIDQQYPEGGGSGSNLRRKHGRSQNSDDDGKTGNGQSHATSIAGKQLDGRTPTISERTPEYGIC
jgi:hypothetical protein